MPHLNQHILPISSRVQVQHCAETDLPDEVNELLRVFACKVCEVLLAFVPAQPVLFGFVFGFVFGLPR